MLPPLMSRVHVLMSVLLVACKSSGGSGSAPPPSASSDAGVAPTPVQERKLGGAASPAPYEEIVIGKPLPAGQVLQVGPPRWSHPGIADHVQLLSTGAIVSASSSHVRLWDAQSGSLRWQVFVPSVRTQFAISLDEKWIAIAQGDFDRGRVSVYELGGKQRVSFEAGPVSALAFSSDGAKLAVAGSVVSLYDSATAKLLKSYKTLAFSVGFSADGRLITVGKERVQRWSDVGDPEQLAAVPTSSRVSAMNMSATKVAWGDGAKLTVMQVGGEPTIVDGAAPASITAIALSAGGDAALVGWAGGVAAWDLAPAPKKRWEMETRFKSRPAVGFAASGKQAAVADARGVFTVEAGTGKEVLAKEEGLRFVGFSSEGNLVVARGKVYQLVDLRTGTISAHPGMPEGAPASADSFLYGTGGLAVSWDSGAQGECKPFTVWISGQGEQTFRTPPGCRDAPWTVGPGFVVADGAKTTVWDVVTNKPRLVLPSTPRPRIGLSFSSDRRWLAAAYGAADAVSSSSDQGSFIRVFDLEAAKAGGVAQVAREFEWKEQAGLRAVAVLSDGTVVAGASDGAVYKAPSGAVALERLSELGAEIVLLDPSPSGKAVAAVDEDGFTAVLEP